MIGTPNLKKGGGLIKKFEIDWNESNSQQVL